MGSGAVGGGGRWGDRWGRQESRMGVGGGGAAYVCYMSVFKSAANHTKIFE